MTATRVVDAAADVVIVGGGPSGLSAAIALRAAGVERVLVLEREVRAGGIPRHADHQGFGLRDLHRAMSGPDYARSLVDRAAAAGARLSPRTQVTGWSADGGLEVTSPDGRRVVHGRAVLLATGCRERPRSARLIAGDRPAGVMTTGTLQQLVDAGEPLGGTRALVVGAEHVSFSALATLAHGGARAIGMTTELARHQSFPAFRVGAALRYRTPLWTRTALRGIHGHGRVEAVTLADLSSGVERRVECDLVVLTGDWIPDHELAVRAGLALDPGTLGPRVDGAGAASRPGVFAAGNLLHGAETADVAALGGRHAAGGIAAWLARADGAAPAAASGGGVAVPIVCAPPLHWMVPGAITALRPRPSRDRFLLRARADLRDVVVELAQDGHTLLRTRLRRVTAGRSTRLPADWTEAVDLRGGPIEVRVLSARRGRRDEGELAS